MLCSLTFISDRGQGRERKQTGLLENQDKDVGGLAGSIRQRGLMHVTDRFERLIASWNYVFCAPN